MNPTIVLQLIILIHIVGSRKCQSFSSIPPFHVAPQYLMKNYPNAGLWHLYNSFSRGPVFIFQIIVYLVQFLIVLTGDRLVITAGNLLKTASLILFILFCHPSNVVRGSFQ